jgi:hypothetical protein
VLKDLPAHKGCKVTGARRAHPVQPVTLALPVHKDPLDRRVSPVLRARPGLKAHRVHQARRGSLGHKVRLDPPANKDRPVFRAQPVPKA